MKKALSTLFILLSLIGKSQTTEESMAYIYALEFINKVPILKLPIEFNCGLEKVELADSIKSVVGPFTPAGYEIMGKLPINSKYNVLIICEQIKAKHFPYIYITDTLGTTTTLQRLTRSKCLIESNFIYKYSIIIDNNNQIVITENELDNKTNKTISEQETVYIINEKGILKKK